MSDGAVDADTAQQEEDELYTVREENITAVGGMEIDIELRQRPSVEEGGAGERDVDTVWAELRDHIGLVAQAMKDETPPSEIEERDRSLEPMGTVDWERVFGGGER